MGTGMLLAPIIMVPTIKTERGAPLRFILSPASSLAQAPIGQAPEGQAPYPEGQTQDYKVTRPEGLGGGTR